MSCSTPSIVQINISSDRIFRLLLAGEARPLSFGEMRLRHPVTLELSRPLRELGLYELANEKS